MNRLLFSLTIIMTGLTVGYGIQRAVRSGRLTLPVSVEELRKYLQKIAFYFLLPIAIAGAIWLIRLENVRIAALPFLGALALSSGGIFALIGSKIMKLPPRQAGAFFGCGSFTNLGSIGGLICFVYLGEHGFALVPIYKLFEELLYYTLGFPIARSFSGREGERSLQGILSSIVRDPLIICSMTGIVTGLILNISHVPRPGIFSVVNSIIVPLSTFVLLVSIGLSLRISRVRTYIRPAIGASLIKFVLVPVLVTGSAFLLGFGRIDDGLPLKVVMILSSMPVAFNALIPPSLYDLDIDLANSCWFVTTGLLTLVLPLLFLLVNSF